VGQRRSAPTFIHSRSAYGSSNIGIPSRRTVPCLLPRQILLNGCCMSKSLEAGWPLAGMSAEGLMIVSKGLNQSITTRGTGDIDSSRSQSYIEVTRNRVGSRNDDTRDRHIRCITVTKFLFTLYCRSSPYNSVRGTHLTSCSSRVCNCHSLANLQLSLET
jgi:hypothetical protein